MLREQGEGKKKKREGEQKTKKPHQEHRLPSLVQTPKRSSLLQLLQAGLSAGPADPGLVSGVAGYLQYALPKGQEQKEVSYDWLVEHLA